MFKPDQPIESVKDDLLDRAAFSQSFGRAILEYKDDESIVTALYGDWGSGKSSVINMALEFIENNTKTLNKYQKPIMVCFNPWNYSDQNQLVSLFFKELSFALRRDDYGEQAKKIGEKLEVYSNFFTPLALIPEPSISVISIVFQRLFKSVGKAAKVWGTAYSSDLNATRKELNTLLAKQKRKIIILIDDIDRLNNVEIRQTFQLVKMLGDFPNTIYILAFDRGIVANAVSKIQEGHGDDYLEKIVQFPVELPPISKSDLDKLMFSQLDDIIKEIPEEKWDSTYWGNIYHSAMKHYFATIRDVTRYINTLKFSFEMVRNDVNPIDFIAITTLQIFEPELYSGIRDNKDIFAGVFGNGSSRDVEIKQAKIRCDEILERSKKLDKKQVIDFLSMLFPNLETIYKNKGYGSDWMKGWRRELRICHPEIFDIYFMLSLPAGEIPKNEIMSVLDLTEDKEAFSMALVKLRDDDRIVRFLELMEDYTEKYIQKGNIQNIISVLMNIGDSFPEGKVGMFGIDTQMRILRIFYQFEKRFETQDERFNILKSAMQEAQESIFTIVHEVGVLGQEHGKVTTKKQLKSEEERAVNAQQLSELEGIAVEKINAWAANGRLHKHPKLLNILYSWRRWNGEGKHVQEYVNNLISTDDGLIEFVAASLQKIMSHSGGDYVSRVKWEINLKYIEDFVSIKDIAPRIRNIIKSDYFNNLNENQKSALQSFLDAYDGKSKDRF